MKARLEFPHHGLGDNRGRAEHLAARCVDHAVTSKVTQGRVHDSEARGALLLVQAALSVVLDADAAPDPLAEELGERLLRHRLDDPLASIRADRVVLEHLVDRLRALHASQQGNRRLVEGPQGLVALEHNGARAADAGRGGVTWLLARRLPFLGEFFEEQRFRQGVMLQLFWINAFVRCVNQALGFFNTNEHELCHRTGVV